MDLGGSSAALDPAGGRSEALLAEIAGQKRVMLEAEQAMFLRIVEWAEENTVEAEEDAATIQDGYLDTGVPIAGDGAPLISEFALMELCATLGRSTGSGREQVGKIVELGYRLTGHWRLVQEGKLEPWRALAIADRTRHLPESAASYVGQHLAPFAATCTWAQISEPSRPRGSAGCVGRGGRVSPATELARSRRAHRDPVPA